MEDKQKEYFIKIFIKKCTSLHNSKQQLEFYFKWCEQTYNVSDEKLKELKEKFTINEYINRFIPAIDKHFTVEELKNIIKFYATSAGKKLLSHDFVQDVAKIGFNMEAQIEQEFALNNNK